MKHLSQSQGNRGYLQISFGWLFAIIVGAFILFLAIFFVTKLVGTQEELAGAKTGEEIGILLSPLETSFETGKTTSFSIPAETRIHALCRDEGTFGKQIIQISQKSFGKWKRTDINVSFQNKYLFSENPEGKEFYIFSKPFNFPFKVADLVYLTSSQDRFCFINPPESIAEEIGDLGQENFQLENCTSNSIKICFEKEAGCNILVSYGSGIIRRDNETLYFYGDALMYAGIFSQPRVYECQVKRLMKRTSQLAKLYREKAVFVSGKGYESNLEGELFQLSGLAEDVEDSSQLIQVSLVAEKIKEKNDDLTYSKLW